MFQISWRKRLRRFEVCLRQMIHIRPGFRLRICVHKVRGSFEVVQPTEPSLAGHECRLAQTLE